MIIGKSIYSLVSITIKEEKRRKRERKGLDQ